MILSLLPLTRHGVREIAIAFVVFVGDCVAAALLLGEFPEAQWAVYGVSALGMLFVLSFFRDPRRVIPPGEEVVVSPADGKVTAVEEVSSAEFLDEPAVRVSIFLSVFNVHINRAPLGGVVRYLRHQDGRYRNAMSSCSAQENERQYIGMESTGRRPFRFLVVQIAGAIARRIVCPIREGDALEKGQRFGMIKFGSRTDLYLPARLGFQCCVTPGDRVRGGATVLGKIATPDAMGAGANAAGRNAETSQPS